MKQTITILFLLFICSEIFGQTAQQDTSFLPPKKQTKNAGYNLVTPKQSEYKLTVPKRKTAQLQEDSVAYTMQEQEVWVDNSENAFTHEINVAKHSLKTERLTYEQMLYLQSLPYIK